MFYVYIYIYMHVCFMHIYIYIYIYICIHESNVPSWLSPQLPYGNPCTWAHDVRFWLYIYVATHALGHMMCGCTPCAQVHELP